MMRDSIDKRLFGLYILVILFSTLRLSNSLCCLVIPNHDCVEKAEDHILHEHKSDEIFTTSPPPKKKGIDIYLLKDCMIDGQVTTKSPMKARNDICILKNCNKEAEAPYEKQKSLPSFKVSWKEYSS